MIVIKKQIRTIIKEKIPNDLIGIIELLVQAYNATADVNVLTRIYLVAFLQVNDNLRIGLCLSALMDSAFCHVS